MSRVQFSKDFNEKIAQFVSEDDAVMDEAAQAMLALIQYSASKHDRTGRYMSSFHVKASNFEGKYGHTIKDRVIVSDAPYVYHLEFGHRIGKNIEHESSSTKKVPGGGMKKSSKNYITEDGSRVKPAYIIANAVRSVGGTLGGANPMSGGR